MRAFTLRRLGRQQLCWRQALAGWEGQIMAGPAQVPWSEDAWLSISADGDHWQALVNPRQWLAAHNPALAALANQAVCDQQIAALFASVDRPLTFQAASLDYQSLQINGLIPAEGSLPAMVVRLDAEQCPVWFSQLPPAAQTDRRLSLHQLAALPLHLEWELGTSLMPVALQPTLAVGDVLLIITPTARIRCQGQTIGHFHYQQRSISMSDYHLDADFFPECEPGLSADDRLPPALESVPLRVEFILQQRYLTLAEVRHLYQGQVVEMEPGAEQQIQVKVNGRLLASGELVQLDDRLGVELTHLTMDPRDE